MLFVKPGPNPDGPAGLHVVRIPNTHALLSPGGQEVPETPFWHRRLLCGDVVLAEPPAAEEAHPAEGETPAHEGPAP